MRVGSVGYATDQGLGILLKEFYDHGVVTDVIQVLHKSFVNHSGWYNDDAPVLGGGTTTEDVRRWLKEIDVMFFFETPFAEWILDLCDEVGVKKMIMPMYECTPRKWMNRMDYVINPSLLDQNYYPEGVFVPVPVHSGTEWRERTTAEVFVHNAGNGGLNGRNGTEELLDAIPHVTSPAKFIIRSQRQISHPSIDNPRVKYHYGTVDRSELWAEGDVFVFPEKFNGLSLPAQEAYASGMAICCNDRFPLNTWLEPKYMIPVSSVYQELLLGNNITVSESSPEDIARTIDGIYGADITETSNFGRRFGRELAWPEMKQEYMHHILMCKMGRKASDSK